MHWKNLLFGSPDNAAKPGVDIALGVLRMAIGWHFLYEGVAKLLTPGWSAADFLMASTGPFAGLFRYIATDPALLGLVNQLNIWGLTLIGATLMLGVLTRPAALCGAAMLGLYYAANPPWFQGPSPAPQEGHYLLVNKNLVELLALIAVLVWPASRFGLEGLLWLLWRRPEEAASQTPAVPAREGIPGLPPDGLSRRCVLAGLSGVPVVGGFAVAALRRHHWNTPEERALADAYSGATAKVSAAKRLEDLQAKLPQGQIGNLKLSRMILGGNLIGGWSHARDLLYASALVKAYHTRGKIFDTFALAEACGVNTILTSPLLSAVINDYWRTTGGKIQFISDLGGKGTLPDRIQQSVDAGAASCYVHGGLADKLVAEGDFDAIAEALDAIRKNGIPAGIGGHKIATVRGCAEKGLKPDYWMKTLHHHNYWSARPELGFNAKDNNWCDDPQGTVEFMKEREEPWIAYKILAAGAIQPKDGFRYAWESGADFICVGMYDFQLVDDVNLCMSILDSKLKPARGWLA